MKRSSKRTCASVRSSLSTRAWLVTAMSEAVETMYPCAQAHGGGREEAAGTASITRFRG